MKHVVVLEDDPSIAYVIENVLADEGYEVSSAQSVQQAEQLIDARTPDVMIMDIMIGGGDQRALYGALRERGYLGPVLITSALGSIDQIAAELGTPYLRKPFDIDELIGALDQICGRLR